ncbi:MAG: DNA photolyase [Armatimonadetes bacterium]|nr:DNA photolyase [Armatimonadota bacterium]
MKQLRGNRAETAAYLAEAFAGLYAGAPTPSPLLEGGRTAGLQRLRVFNVERYDRDRNDVGTKAGASLMAPYLRHGCVTLGEAKADAVGKIGADAATKWIQELGWRQFWQLQYERDGSRIFEPMEQPKVPLSEGDENTPVPDDVLAANTGLNCMDISLRSLYETGYMFNHARMWFAAWYVHFRKEPWQAGAKLLYRYLLCGDPASNTLSWQWVASTFSHKPYFFNRGNVEKYSRDPDGSTYCTTCPAAYSNTCPFDASYETLGRRLFGDYYQGDSRNGGNTGKRGDMASRRSSFRR